MCGKDNDHVHNAQRTPIVHYKDDPRWQGPLIPNPHAPQGDVRGSSIDTRYQGVVFTGPWAHAMRQARNAPEHPIPFVKEAKAAGVSLARYELLKFLRVL